ncbi:MAG: 16S rRNA (cytosine(1402)-N(4))-methyltransferase RsmH [Candidatus Aminicenantes bacterium]|nr:16S rRNA (cytosine(1402)-N(4))-methyltransferase RsmH [Candidatus Aminicenantes bacterium]
MSRSAHTPVLPDEVMSYLDIQRKGVYLDCTLGLGGHSAEILKRNKEARIIGFDIDEKSLMEAKKNLQPYADRVTLYHSDYRYIPELKLDFPSVRGVLLDLGLSSFQLDDAQRGFSFNKKGPLDMRMDHRNKTTASKILNKSSEKKLAQIFREYGELRQAKILAKEIYSRRKNNPINTTEQLLQLTEDLCRWRPQKGKTHPAARVFQALRIEVNQELKNLDTFLEKIIKLTPPHTRTGVISFHSLEDRIVKHTMKKLASSNKGSPLITLLTKKPVTPSKNEIQENFRSRSAKLRVSRNL